MNQWRRRIPVIAASSMAVGGLVTACGGDSKAERIANAYCEYASECYEDYFDEEWDSVSDCVAEITDDINDDVDDARADGVSNACINASLTLDLCQANGYDSQACDYDADCDDEEEDYYDACDGEDFRRGATRIGARRVAAR